MSCRSSFVKFVEDTPVMVAHATIDTCVTVKNGIVTGAKMVKTSCEKSYDYVKVGVIRGFGTCKNFFC